MCTKGELEAVIARMLLVPKAWAGSPAELEGRFLMACAMLVSMKRGVSLSRAVHVVKDIQLDVQNLSRETTVYLPPLCADDSAPSGQSFEALQKRAALVMERISALGPDAPLSP